MDKIRNDEIHHCTSERLGDLIIWKCPICPDYERIFNWKIGRFESVKSNEINHIGTSQGSNRDDVIIPLTKNINLN